MLGAILLGAVRASAATIVTLLSSGAQPYLDAQQQIQQAASAHGDSVRSVLLADASKKKALRETDVVVAIGSEAAAWARDNAPGDGPLYYCMVPSAAELGLNNCPRVCRGVETDVPLAEQIALIARTLPQARTVGMLYRSDLEQGRKAKADMEAALPGGWKLQAVAVNDFETKSKAIDALLERRVDVIWTSPDPTVYDIPVLKALLLAALRQAVPVYGFSQAIVKSGGLVGTNISPDEQGRQAASLVTADLDAARGNPSAKPRPEARPPRYEIAVNAIVAKKLGITIPQSLRESAAHVYENE